MGVRRALTTDYRRDHPRTQRGDLTLTAVITSDALADLKLRRGDETLAIIKATDVMIAREADVREEETHEL